jgi:hypothetical protein
VRTRPPFSLRPVDVERFWSKVNRSAGPDACWPWRGSLDAYGYGQFSLGRSRVKAHRVAYQLQRGSIPSGLAVCHRCDNRVCCNASHHFLGTERDNIGDAYRKGRVAGPPPNPMPGELAPGAKLTEGQVLEMKRLRRDRGLAYTEIGPMFGVHPTTAREAVIGRTWRHLGGIS